MKSKKFSILPIVFIIILIFSACTNSNLGELSKTVEFGSNASNVLINTKKPESLSFNIALFSNKNIRS